jgi:hypothetical protein
MYFRTATFTLFVSHSPTMINRFNKMFCIVPITHGLPLGFIKLRSISSPLTLTDQSVTLLGGTIALGLKCSGITFIAWMTWWTTWRLYQFQSLAHQASQPAHLVTRWQDSSQLPLWEKILSVFFQFLSVQIPAWFSVASYLVHISYSWFRMAITTTEKVCIVSILWLPLAGSTLR